MIVWREMTSDEQAKKTTDIGITKIVPNRIV